MDKLQGQEEQVTRITEEIYAMFIRNGWKPKVQTANKETQTIDNNIRTVVIRPRRKK